MEDAINTGTVAGADYVVYKAFACHKVLCVETRSIVATCAGDGLDIVAAGLSARGKSLFDYDADEFVCGSMGQLTRRGFVAI